MHSKENIIKQLRKIYINNYLNQLGTLKNILETCDLNDKYIKLRKHYPFSLTDDILFNDIEKTKEYIQLKFSNNGINKYFENDYSNNDAHSFTFNEKTLEKHKNLLLSKVNEHIDNVTAIMSSNEHFENNFINLIDTNKEYLDKTGRRMYDYAVRVNVFPMFSFCDVKNGCHKIAKYYVIAKNLQNKLSIFFDYSQKFSHMEYAPNCLESLINKFNNKENNDIISKLYIIIRNMNILDSIGFGTFNNVRFTMSVTEIDEIPTITFETGEQKFGWIYFPIEKIKANMTFDNGTIYKYSNEFDRIQKDKNKKIIGL